MPSVIQSRISSPLVRGGEVWRKARSVIVLPLTISASPSPHPSMDSWTFSTLGPAIPSTHKPCSGNKTWPGLGCVRVIPALPGASSGPGRHAQRARGMGGAPSSDHPHCSADPVRTRRQPTIRIAARCLFCAAVRSPAAARRCSRPKAQSTARENAVTQRYLPG